MGKRRRRDLSAEERALWERLRATVVPLNPEAATDEPPVLEPVSLAPPPPPPLTPPAPPRIPAPQAKPRAPEPPAAPGVRMDRRRFDRLRRGQLKPEARIDLHGMTAARAHAALTGFVFNAHASGLRLVLVITGKGRPGEDFMSGESAGGVLRRSVPHWLSLPPLTHKVLQLAPAHRRHGGDGAFYVYLARSRSGA